jgi:hypothetical protein
VVEVSVCYLGKRAKTGLVAIIELNDPIPLKQLPEVYTPTDYDTTQYGYSDNVTELDSESADPWVSPPPANYTASVGLRTSLSAHDGVSSLLKLLTCISSLSPYPSNDMTAPLVQPTHAPHLGVLQGLVAKQQQTAPVAVKASAGAEQAAQAVQQPMETTPASTQAVVVDVAAPVSQPMETAPVSSVVVTEAVATTTIAQDAPVVPVPEVSMQETPAVAVGDTPMVTQEQNFASAKEAFDSIWALMHAQAEKADDSQLPVFQVMMSAVKHLGSTVHDTQAQLQEVAEKSSRTLS